MLDWEDIKDSLDLEAVLDELGLRGERTRGWVNMSCPLSSHPGSDKTPSFGINEIDLWFNCFACGGAGPLPLLVADLQDFTTDEDSTSFQKGTDWLSQFSDALLDDDHFLDHLERILRPSDDYVRFFHPILPIYDIRALRGLELATVEQMSKWSIEQNTIQNFQFCFDPSRRRISGSEEYIGEALIIPHFYEGELIGWQERWLGDRPKWLPKYTNTRDFPRGTTLFNWDEARKADSPVVVVEAPLTVARLRQLGYNAVATFGARISSEQIYYLRTLQQGVILSFDNDPDMIDMFGRSIQGAGEQSLRKTISQLDPYVPTSYVRVPGKIKGDLADLSNSEIIDVLSKPKPGFLL